VLLRKSQTGFTLVELMIVVVILIILAGVGYPLYQDQLRKARRTDARSAAMQVALAQEQYFTRTGRYTIDLSDSDLNLHRGLETGASEGGYYKIAVARPDR
jgi:type IV pilus assembly protein PilE